MITSMSTTKRKMTVEDWGAIRFFKPNENFGNPMEMDYDLIYGIDLLRQYIKKPIIIHCGYEKRSGSSYHNTGEAIDCHCKDINLIDFFIGASRFACFRGIGIYPNWNNPGLHLDTRRDGDFRALWTSFAAGKYLSLNNETLKQIINKK